MSRAKCPCDGYYVPDLRYVHGANCSHSPSLKDLINQIAGKAPELIKNVDDELERLRKEVARLEDWQKRAVVYVQEMRERLRRSKQYNPNEYGLLVCDDMSLEDAEQLIEEAK